LLEPQHFVGNWLVVLSEAVVGLEKDTVAGWGIGVVDLDTAAVYSSVDAGFGWVVLACAGLGWLVLACAGFGWLVLACAGFGWLVLACAGFGWLVLACPGNDGSKLGAAGESSYFSAVDCVACLLGLLEAVLAPL